MATGRLGTGAATLLVPTPGEPSDLHAHSIIRPGEIATRRGFRSLRRMSRCDIFGRWALAGDGESLWKGKERTSHQQSVNQLGSISYYWWIMGEISTSVESTCGVCSVRCKAGLYGGRILRNSPPCIGGVASTRYGYINKGLTEDGEYGKVGMNLNSSLQKTINILECGRVILSWRARYYKRQPHSQDRVFSGS
uniref:Uncharacterized protein n=1 Tax=Coccidioides posadasii RMSCC 3488 TaxID=454284 RepID=A0A0J6FAN9_COCPO|nr:hypothetical protein CPAG_02650 [Coccidioides posadasii RMSCC 3488]